MKKTVISEIENREAFLHLLGNNPGLILLKFGATWCGPCKKIKPLIDGFFATTHEDVVCCEIDVDECFDVYALLKSKKMINGIPVILCYKRGNETIYPDDSITGASAIDLDNFFKRCGQHLNEVRQKKYNKKI